MLKKSNGYDIDQNYFNKSNNDSNNNFYKTNDLEIDNTYTNATNDLCKIEDIKIKKDTTTIKKIILGILGVTAATLAGVIGFSQISGFKYNVGVDFFQYSVNINDDKNNYYSKLYKENTLIKTDKLQSKNDIKIKDLKKDSDYYFEINRKDLNGEKLYEKVLLHTRKDDKTPNIDTLAGYNHNPNTYTEELYTQLYIPKNIKNTVLNIEHKSSLSIKNISINVNKSDKIKIIDNLKTDDVVKAYLSYSIDNISYKSNEILYIQTNLSSAKITKITSDLNNKNLTIDIQTYRYRNEDMKIYIYKDNVEIFNKSIIDNVKIINNNEISKVVVPNLEKDQKYKIIVKGAKKYIDTEYIFK